MDDIVFAYGYLAGSDLEKEKITQTFSHSPRDKYRMVDCIFRVALNCRRSGCDYDALEFYFSPDKRFLPHTEGRRVPVDAVFGMGVVCQSSQSFFTSS